MGQVAGGRSDAADKSAKSMSCYDIDSDLSLAKVQERAPEYYFQLDFTGMGLTICG